MYKTLALAVLLLPTLALAQTNQPATPFPSPLIVAKAKLLHQAAPISTTTIFTPTQDGLYRMSVYATLLSAPCVGGNWNFNLTWTDDAGPQGMYSLLYGGDCNLGVFQQFFNAFGSPAPFGGVVTTFEAKAAQPIAYSVTYEGNPDGTSYSLYYTLERLE